jgi:hypothetical protein
LRLQKLEELRRLLEVSEETRKGLLKQIKHRRETIKLIGADFEDFEREVKLNLCISEENKATLLLAKGQQKKGDETMR